MCCTYLNKLRNGASATYLFVAKLLSIGIIVSAYQYIATTTLATRVVFLEYLRQFLIDLHQTYRHSSVPKNTSPCIF